MEDVGAKHVLYHRTKSKGLNNVLNMFGSSKV